jgi:hypothetical protein
MGNHINTNLLPLEVDDSPWLYERKNEINNQLNDPGKWMLFYTKELLNEKWKLARELYNDNKLTGVVSMKCSTNFKNPRASSENNGIIILYCENSKNEEVILNIGKNILEKFYYENSQMIYYKTDLQTYEGTIATGSKQNHTYKLVNPYYKKVNNYNFTFKNLNSNKTYEIIRNYPIEKNEKMYPFRYDNNVFNEYNKIKNDIEFKNDYIKLKNGINYKTNRKIKINGKSYDELKKKFYINCMNGQFVLFKKLDNINIENYLQETINIKSIIDKENLIIKKYNNDVNEIIKKINKLKNWNDYIEFEGKYYGICYKVINYIHVENNCKGNMLFYREYLEECGKEWFGGCTIDYKNIKEYKCNKCAFITENIYFINYYENNNINNQDKINDVKEIEELEKELFG